MLINARTGAVIACDVEIADTRATRRRGLLGRDFMDATGALLLSPCFSIHTLFMRFPIDVIFVDRDGVVVRTIEDMRPWRMAAAPHAHATIEIVGGGLKSRDVRVGDRLYLSASPKSEVRSQKSEVRRI